MLTIPTCSIAFANASHARSELGQKNKADIPRCGKERRYLTSSASASSEGGIVSAEVLMRRRLALVAFVLPAPARNDEEWRDPA
jgi:hypothetical protein